jgi:hypothetical protein
MRRSIPAVALLALIAAAPAGAQSLSRDLPIVTLHQQGHSGLDTPQTRVIKTMADYRAFFAGTNVDVGLQPRVDFATEEVLVAAAGTKPSGGYGIQITKCTLMTGGFTGGHAFVEVQESAPPPGSIVTMALTSPVHVVKVPKGAIAYHFNVVAPANFRSIDLLIEDPFKQTTERLVLQANGDAVITRSSPTARYAPLNGMATTAELRAVSDAFRRADVLSLPKTIPDPRMFIVAPPVMTLTSTLANGQSNTTGATLGYYTPYEARVEPLMSALQAITRRLIGPPAFESIRLVSTGGFRLFRTQEMTIQADGTTVVVREHHDNTTQYWNGRATAAELRALVDAVNAADMAGLPASIDDPIFVTDIPELDIETSLGGNTYRTHVAESGFYGSFEARLQPVDDAVSAIVDRVLSSGASTITGLVRRNLPGLLTVDGVSVPASEPLRDLIARNVGKTMTLTGRVFMSNGVRTIDVATVKGETTAALNFRRGPSTGYGVIRVLARGTAVDVLNRQGLWLYVEVAGRRGWVHGDYIRVAK